MRVHRSQGGIVLLDGLIAIVMFSIGILGIVMLQGKAITMTSDAKLRTNAAMLAENVIAQMWASNPSTLAATFAGTGGTGGTGYTQWTGLVADPVIGLPGVTSTANQPTITVDASNNVVVTVFWNAPNDKVVHSYVSATQVTR
jgi:type IV pilus assembly protein PilV